MAKKQEAEINLRFLFQSVKKGRQKAAFLV